MSLGTGSAANLGILATAAATGYAAPHYTAAGSYRSPAESPKTPASPPGLGAAPSPELYFICQKCRKGYRVLPTVELSKGADDSFKWIEDTFADGMTAEQLQATASVLYQYAADHVGTNAPLCKECNDDVARGIVDYIKLMGADEAQYAWHWRQVSGETDGIAVDDLREKVAVLDSEEQALRDMLATLEADVQEIHDAAAVTARERKATQGRVLSFWENTTALRVAEHDLSEALSAVHHRLELTETRKATIGATNLINETFHIWYDGHFGTINNLRLGRLPSRPVEQNEMNAAWGYASQLLDRLMTEWGVEPTRYKVNPKGSFTTVATVVPPNAKKKELSTYELYTGATGLWATTRHDHAIKGFACCVDELCRRLLNHAPQGHPAPFPQEEDRINGLSVKQSAQGQTEENWTRALKYLLLNLKWAMGVTALQVDD